MDISTGLNVIRVQILRKHNEALGFTKDSHNLSDRATIDACRSKLSLEFMLSVELKRIF